MNRRRLGRAGMEKVVCQGKRAREEKRWGIRAREEENGGRRKEGKRRKTEKGIRNLSPFILSKPANGCMGRKS